MFGTTSDILVVVYDDGGRYHNNKLWRVLLIYRKVNLKLNRKMSFLVFISPKTNTAVANKAENGVSIKSLKQITEDKADINIQMWYSRI